MLFLKDRSWPKQCVQNDKQIDRTRSHSLAPLQVNGEAAEGCRANSLRGIDRVRATIKVTSEKFEMKNNLRICLLDFLSIALISRNSIFSEYIDLSLVGSTFHMNHDRWNVPIYCK